MSTTNTLGLFLHHLALSEEVGRLGATSDHDLLAAYEAERGQAAFTELMRRHGPMVLRTCRRVLGRGSDAEDAFQATFVLLARKADQLRKEAAGRQSLGGWLHRVAYQTSLDVLAKLTRRRVHERQVASMSHPEPDPSVEATWNEIRPILDAELNALPEESRRLLIACHLQGKTHAEAAAALGLPLGSLARRLEKARALLAERLVRRGITVSVSLLAMLLDELAKGAGVPAVLLVHTVEAARTFSEQAAGMVSENVARLVKGGLAQMAKGSTNLSIALAGWVGLLGAGLIACQALKAWPDGTPQSEPPAAAERPAQERNKRTLSDALPPGALARLGTVRLRQVTSVHSLAFTCDGKGLITVGKGDLAQLWDVADGRLLRQFGDSRDDQVYAAALSPDGKTLAGRVAAGDLCLWNVAKGTLLHRLKGAHVGGVAPLAFSPDGKTVASRDGQTLRLWEVATGKELLAVGQLPVNALTYSADGKALIWAGYQGDLHLCDAATGKELRRWDDEKKRSISALARSRDGRLFAAYGPRGAAGGRLARLWDVATGKEVWQRVGEEESIITAAAFSPDSKILALGYNRGPIRLWNAATGEELRRCVGRRTARCLAFSPDGKTLASGDGGEFGNSRDQTVHLWDVGSGREIHRMGDGHEAAVASATFTPDGKDIVSTSWDGSLRVWDAAAGEQRRQVLAVGDEFFNGRTITSIAGAVSADGKTLVSATGDQQAARSTESKFSVKVRRWDRDSGRELRGWTWELGKRVPVPHTLVISPGGKTVAAMTIGAPSAQVHLWETATGKELSPIAGGYPAFSLDGKMLATTSARGRLGEPGSFTLWETATAKELGSAKGLAGIAPRLLFSPDGRMLATASRGGAKGVSAVSTSQPSTIHLWPLLRDESGKAGVRVGPSRLLPGGTPPRWLGAWAFSPDGRTLALAGEGGTVRLLETAGGKERSRFAGHGGDVTALSFAPDGYRLASGSRDTTLLVWDVTGRLQEGRLRRARLSAKEIEKLWADLAADDAGRAGRAIWTLAAAPAQAVPYLEEHLRTLAVDAKALAKVPQLLRDLDNDVFAAREKAKAELARLGEAVEPALRQALAKSPPLAVRRSLEQLLEMVDAKRQSPSGEALRGVRAVEVLEHIGTHEAREALKNLTAGAGAEPSLTREAHAALQRLGRAERR